MVDSSIASVRIQRVPIHPLIVCFPTTCLTGALLTDITYWCTAEMMWADFSAWLVSAGTILAWLAAIVGIVDIALGRARPAGTATWIYVAATVVVLVLATFNMAIHTRDTWTSVVPWGLVLSGATVAVLVLTTCIGWARLLRVAR
jgi:uncharacterized membrane protein